MSLTPASSGRRELPIMSEPRNAGTVWPLFSMRTGCFTQNRNLDRQQTRHQTGGPQAYRHSKPQSCSSEKLSAPCSSLSDLKLSPFFRTPCARGRAETCLRNSCFLSGFCIWAQSFFRWLLDDRALQNPTQLRNPSMTSENQRGPCAQKHAASWPHALRRSPSKLRGSRGLWLPGLLFNF